MSCIIGSYSVGVEIAKQPADTSRRSTDSGLAATGSCASVVVCCSYRVNNSVTCCIVNQRTRVEPAVPAGFSRASSIARALNISAKIPGIIVFGCRRPLRAQR